MELRDGKTAKNVALLILCTLVVLQSGLVVAMEKKEVVKKKSAEEQEKLDDRLLAVLWDKNLDAVKKILQEGANVHATGYWGRTPFHLAVIYGYFEMVRLFIENGANVHATDKTKRTPLHMAAFYGYLEVVRLLIENDASVHATDDSKWTPLHEAASWGYLEVARLLIENGAKVDATNDDGDTPLHRAAKRGHPEMVAYLALVEALLAAIQDPDKSDSFAKKYLELSDTQKAEQNLKDTIGILAPRLATTGKEFREKLFTWMRQNKKLLFKRNQSEDEQFDTKWFYLDLVYQTLELHTKFTLLRDCFKYLQKTDDKFREAVTECISREGQWIKNNQNVYTQKQCDERQNRWDVLNQEKNKIFDQNKLFAACTYTKKLVIPTRLPKITVLNDNATVTRPEKNFIDAEFEFKYKEL